VNKPTLLIVDDEPQNLHILIQVLKSDYQIKLAKTGSKALVIAQTSAPDLILLDVNMPEMDGFDVCQQLKSNPDTRSIPVIFLSASDTETDREKGLSLGAHDFMIKSVVPATLKTSIQKALEE